MTTPHRAAASALLVTLALAPSATARDLPEPFQGVVENELARMKASLFEIRSDAALLREEVRAPCFKLHRLVEWRNAAGPDPKFNYWNDSTSFISSALIPNIEGIMTPWTHKIRAENLWLTRLKLTAKGLAALVTFEKNDFPMKDKWDIIWKRNMTFSLDKPEVFASSILERSFRVTMTLSDEPDKTLCRMPDIPLRRPKAP